jgi:hypothetical protein
VIRGKGGEVHPMMYVATTAFLLYFAMPALRRLLAL